VVQCVAVCCSMLQCTAVCCDVLRCVAVCCSVLQCVAVCCSVLRCVALCCSVFLIPTLMSHTYESIVTLMNLSSRMHGACHTHTSVVCHDDV